MKKTTPIKWWRAFETTVEQLNHCIGLVYLSRRRPNSAGPPTKRCLASGVFTRPSYLVKKNSSVYKIINLFENGNQIVQRSTEYM